MRATKHRWGWALPLTALGVVACAGSMPLDVGSSAGSGGTTGNGGVTGFGNTTGVGLDTGMAGTTVMVGIAGTTGVAGTIGIAGSQGTTCLGPTALPVNQISKPV